MPTSKALFVLDTRSYQIRSHLIKLYEPFIYPTAVRSKLIGLWASVSQDLNFVPVVVFTQHLYPRTGFSKANGLIRRTRTRARFTSVVVTPSRPDDKDFRKPGNPSQRVPLRRDVFMRGQQHSREAKDEQKRNQESPGPALLCRRMRLSLS